MVDKFSSGMKTATSLTKDVLLLNVVRFQLHNDHLNELNQPKGVLLLEKNRVRFQDKVVRTAK